MAVFRVEKTKDFTVMSNHHLRNPDGFGQGRNVYFVVNRSHPGLVDLFLTQARLDYTKEHGKKVSIRESMKQNTEQTAAVHTPTKRKEPEW